MFLFADSDIDVICCVIAIIHFLINNIHSKKFRLPICYNKINLVIL